MEGFEVVQQVINPAGLVSSLEIKPDEYLLPLHEVVVNAIQSIEDSKNKSQGKIIIRVKRGNQIKMEIEGAELIYSPIAGFSVEDNGVGFNDKRFEAFTQPYTNFNIKKGGKGMGRYTVLACFGNMEVDSTYQDGNITCTRKIKFDVQSGLQKLPDSKNPKADKENRTIVTLNNYRGDYYNVIKNNRVSLNDIAEGIIQHCLLYFINTSAPTIYVVDENEKMDKAIVLNDIFRSVISIEREEKNISLQELKDSFNISYVRNYNSGQSHSIHLCANNRQVGNKQALTAYLPSFRELYDENQKKYFLSLYVTSEFLNGKVHPQRNKFTIPEAMDKKTPYDEISLEELFTNVSDNVRTLYNTQIDTAEKEKNERIRKYILDPNKPRLRYRHLLTVENAFNDIPINASDEVLEAKLHEKEYKLEVSRDKAFNRVFKAKKYDKDEFAKVVHEVLSQEAAFSKDKLADLMIKRKSVIKLFEKYLQWRDDKNFMLEEDLHNIIFTMGAQTDDMPSNYHNLWLLDERFTFHTHTSSDTKTKKVKRIKSDGKKESDLLVYDFPWAYNDNIDKINSLVVFEFKRPGRAMKKQDEKKLDTLVQKYFEDLMKSSARNVNGKLLNIEKRTPKFGYVVCEVDSELKQYNKDWNDFKETPFGHLYKINPELNLHIEVMTYEQMLQFATSRHEAFFKALGVESI